MTSLDPRIIDQLRGFAAALERSAERECPCPQCERKRADLIAEARAEAEYVLHLIDHPPEDPA